MNRGAQTSSSVGRSSPPGLWARARCGRAGAGWWGAGWWGAALVAALTSAGCGGGGGGDPVAPTSAQPDRALTQGLQCIGPAGSGWCWQRPQPQGNTVADVAVTPGGRAYAVGEAGTLLMATGHGAPWAAQRPPTAADLLKVVAVDDRVVWLAAQGGELLLSTDGGLQWRSSSLGLNETIESLGANSEREAWVLTANGTRYTTSDGGQRWQRMAAPPAVQGATLSAADGSVWVLPVFSYQGDGFGFGLNFARSGNGGAVWQSGEMPPLAPGLSRNTTSLQALSTAWALLKTTDAGFETGTDRFISTTQVWRTTDGGARWLAVQRAPNDRDGGSSAPGDAAATNARYQAITTDTLFAMASGETPYRSSDGGQTWAAVPLPPEVDAPARIQRLQALDATRLLLVTTSGRHFYSRDAGATWSEWPLGGRAGQPVLTSVNFFDRSEGLATAADGSSLRTTDGGRSWVAEGNPVQAGGVDAQPRNRLQARFLPGSRTGWRLAGADNTVWRSTDGGRNWAAPTAGSAPMAGIEDLHFIDSQRGWAVRSVAADGMTSVFASSNGGQTWQALNGSTGASGLSAVRFAANGLHGVAVGNSGTALLTADGGQTWQARSVGTALALRRLAWLGDGTTVLAVGDAGVVMRSTDRGATWQRAATPTDQALNDVQFTSNLRGWAVGEQGTLLHTTDGGQSWALVATGTRAHLLGLQFIDDSTGWLVGAGGTVLVTVSGGR